MPDRRWGGGCSTLFRLGTLLMIGGVFGCASNSPDYNQERTFATPEAAVASLAEATRTQDVAALQALFGPDADDLLSSGDLVADRSNREVLAVAIHDRWKLREIDPKTRELVIGYEDWPFPVPLVKDGRGWWFNTVAGREEVLARRVGRNELAAIGTVMTYVLAQREYASLPRDGRPAGVYAQKIRSDSGRQDGLYWRVAGLHEAPSPLAQLAATAKGEGYPTDQPAGTRAFHGYIFRILTRQGSAAPGGAMDYVVNGDMTRGFAMIAYPARFGNSGVMTFIVGPDGIIYERDLGEDTAYLAGAITEFNPDRGWRAVE